MAVTKQKKKRLFMGLCTIENQLGWVPVQSVMFGLAEQEEQGFGRALGPWIFKNPEVDNHYFKKCGISVLNVIFLTKVKDVFKKTTVFANNLETPRGICNFNKKTFQALTFLIVLF